MEARAQQTTGTPASTTQWRVPGHMALSSSSPAHASIDSRECACSSLRSLWRRTSSTSPSGNVTARATPRSCENTTASVGRWLSVCRARGERPWSWFGRNSATHFSQWCGASPVVEVDALCKSCTQLPLPAADTWRKPTTAAKSAGRTRHTRTVAVRVVCVLVPPTPGISPAECWPRFPTPELGPLVDDRRVDMLSIRVEEPVSKLILRRPRREPSAARWVGARSHGQPLSISARE